MVTESQRTPRTQPFRSQGSSHRLEWCMILLKDPVPSPKVSLRGVRVGKAGAKQVVPHSADLHPWNAVVPSRAATLWIRAVSRRHACLGFGTPGFGNLRRMKFLYAYASRVSAVSVQSHVTVQPPSVRISVRVRPVVSVRVVPSSVQAKTRIGSCVPIGSDNPRTVAAKRYPSEPLNCSAV